MTKLSPQHARAIAHGLYSLASVDGVHPAETLLVQEFFGAAQGEFGSVSDLVTPFDTKQAAQVLDTPELKAAFLQSCVLLAYADGRYSAAERAKVAEFAQALGVREAERADIEEAVSDHLMQQIARIENIDALGEVAQELKAR